MDRRQESRKCLWRYIKEQFEYKNDDLLDFALSILLLSAPSPYVIDVMHMQYDYEYVEGGEAVVGVVCTVCNSCCVMLVAGR